MKYKQMLKDYKKFWNFDGTITKEQFIKKYGMSPSYFQVMYLQNGLKEKYQVKRKSVLRQKIKGKINIKYIKKQRAGLIKHLGNNWIRDKSQENGTQVFRWYENIEKGIIASVVSGYFENELNIRISQDNNNFKPIEIRGHKSIMKERTDLEFIETFERFIKRVGNLRSIKQNGKK